MSILRPRFSHHVSGCATPSAARRSHGHRISSRRKYGDNFYCICSRNGCVLRNLVSLALDLSNTGTLVPACRVLDLSKGDERPFNNPVPRTKVLYHGCKQRQAGLLHVLQQRYGKSDERHLRYLLSRISKQSSTISCTDSEGSAHH